MCDVCGKIFSENEEDWSTFQGSRKRRREDGSRYVESVDQDRCPACTNGSHPVTPHLAIPAGADPDLYTKFLEQQAGIVPGEVIPSG